MSETNADRQASWFKKLSLTTWIFIALVCGVVVGFLMQGAPEVASTYIKPFGTIFLNLLKFICVPLVLFSIICGVISLDDARKVGSIGGKTIVLYLLTTVFAVCIGLVFANVLNVSAGYTLSAEELSYEAAEAPTFMDTLVNIFPSNFLDPMVQATMLQVIVIALFFGFGIMFVGQKATIVKDFCIAMAEVCMKVMQGILYLAPIGVFGLLVPVVATNGPDILGPLVWLIAVMAIACIVQVAVVYTGLIKFLARRSPLKFLKGEAPVMSFAFASASSMGTLPINMECAEKMGVSKEVTSFVLPLGATINMDGTSIYQGICAVFIAQVFGIDLSIGAQVTIVLTALLASIGTAGVPGSGMIMLALVLGSVGLPLEGIALVAGVDRILDMLRTTVNVTGDGAVAQVVDAMEKRKQQKRQSTNEGIIESA